MLEKNHKKSCFSNENDYHLIPNLLTFRNMFINKPILICLIFLSSINSIFANEINIYTSRHYDLDVKLYQDFTDLTGIKVNIISAKCFNRKTQI